MTPTSLPSPEAGAVAPAIGYVSDYGLGQLAKRAHQYCLTVSKAPEKEFTNPIYAILPAAKPAVGVVEVAREIVKANTTLPPDAVRAGLYDHTEAMRCTLAALSQGATPEAERTAKDTALADMRAEHTAARQNFHTMQHAANALRQRAEAAESELAQVKKALEAMREEYSSKASDLRNDGNTRRGYSWAAYALGHALSPTNPSPDGNKGETK